MAIPKPQRMTADAFFVWAATQRGRYELAAGEVVAMAPERAAHNRVKFAAGRALQDAARGLACEVFVDGMVVRIDDATVYEPDATVRCGVPLADHATEFSDPVVVVEVLSPNTQARDVGAKLEDYFRLPSVRHYLIVSPERHTVVHHDRDEAGIITTTIVKEGSLRLVPPGIEVTVAELFAAP
ncbi:MAG: Uma2 family endonuclease [Myxococcota bacterium]